MKNILCTICARSGSIGIKNKNLIKINDQPLFSFTLFQAKKLSFIDNIVLSTDSKKISNQFSKYGLNSFFLRSKKLSNSSSGKVPVIRDALYRSEKYYNKKYDYIIDLDVTSPLRIIKDIKAAYKKFIEDDADNLITVCNAKKNPYFNMVEYNKNTLKLVKPTKKILSRQAAPLVYEMNASIYIWKRKCLISSNNLFTKKTSMYIMPSDRSIDIDNNFDLKIVKYLMKKK